MQKTLAFFSGTLAAAFLLASPGQAQSYHHEHGGREGARGGYGERGDRREGGEGFRDLPRGYQDSRDGYREPRGQGDYRDAPRPQVYERGYAPQRRPNSLGSQWREQQEEARSAVRQGQMAPLGNVIAGIGRRSRGRALDAGIEYQGSRAVYRVRWLMNNGRRVDYLVDAATGRILSEH